MKYDSKKAKKYLVESLIGVGLGVCVVGAYARYWEYSQPKQEVKNVVVNNIEPYNFRNDLHWNLSGYRININEDIRNIDFPSENWNKKIQVGDTIDMVIRCSYPMGIELDGFSIKKSNNK
jgi:hypothetical protein